MMEKAVSVFMLDDDWLALHHTERLVDWQALGYDKPVTCTSITKARQICAQQYFNVFLLDIEVPGGSGLDLACEIKTRHPEAYIIMLTSYREFQYARTAVSIGVYDYLIKHELTSDILAEKLADIKLQLYNRLQNRRLMQETALSMLLSEDVQNIDKISYMLGYDKRWMTLFHLQKPVSWPHTVVPQAQLHDAEALVQSETVLTFLSDGLWILTLAEERKALATVNQMVKTKLSEIPLCLIESNLITAVQQIPSQRRFCLQEENRRFIKGSGSDGHNILPTCEADSDKQYNADVLLRAWQSQNASRVEQELLLLEETIASCSHPTVLLDKVLRSLLTSCGIIQPASAMLSLREVMQWLRGKLTEAWVQYAELKELTIHTRHVIEYLREHPVASMAELSEELDMSEGYLRSVFKKDMKQTISDYMLSRRIEHAKYLLCEKNMRVNDVARVLQYQSSQYFSYVFRKYTGMTPITYVQAYRQKEEG